MKRQYASIAMYNQNYLFLKHILNLEKQNKQINDLLKTFFNIIEYSLMSN